MTEYNDEIEKPENINDFDRAEIARFVENGNTSGILDRDGFRISWRLDADIFQL